MQVNDNVLHIMKMIEPLKIGSGGRAVLARNDEEGRAGGAFDCGVAAARRAEHGPRRGRTRPPPAREGCVGAACAVC